MKFFKIITLFLIISSVSFADFKYEDINKDNFAYNSIDELCNEGIFDGEAFKFEGEKYVTRYDFAYFLARAVKTININKASRKSLMILQSLIEDFSDELNEIGFETEKFEKYITESSESIEILQEKLNTANNRIDRLQQRILKLENKIN